MSTNNGKPQQPTNGQPNAKPPMKPKGLPTKMLEKASDSFADEVGKDGADQAVQYEIDNAQQQIDDVKQKLDDAKTQAEGMWAKFCGCFSGA